MTQTSDRLLKVGDELEKHHLDAILVSSIPNIIYLTGYSNFLPIEREAYLLIVAQPQGLTHKTPGVIGYFITDGRYAEAVALHVPNFVLIERSFKNPLKKIFEDLAKRHKIKLLGIEEYTITIAEQKILADCFNDTNHYSVRSLRAVKDQSEIYAIEEACKLADKAFIYILKNIKKGISEKEVAFELEYYVKKQGAGLSFPSIVAFGKNSSIPHHQTSNQELITNNFVLLDFGVKLNNYCSDMTRTIIFGKATAEQKRMYQTVLTAQSLAIEHLGRWRSNDFDSSEVDSIKAKDLDKVAREYIIQQGYPSIPHSLGHGIGLEVHESPTLSPNSKDQLKPGMVFSVEPGIYKPGFGGVRIEDLVALEPTGPRVITKASKEMIIL